VVHIQLEHLLLDHAASDERVFTAAWFIWPAMHQPQHNCRRPAQTIHWNAQQLVTAQTVYVSRSDLVNDENTRGRKADTFTANIHGLYLPEGGQGFDPLAYNVWPSINRFRGRRFNLHSLSTLPGANSSTVKTNLHLARHVTSRHDTFDVSSPCILALSSMSNITARHARLDALDTSNVSCRDMTWRAKWNIT